MKKLQVLIPIMLVFTFLTACGTVTVDSVHPVVRTADLGKEKPLSFSRLPITHPQIHLQLTGVAIC